MAEGKTDLMPLRHSNSNEPPLHRDTNSISDNPTISIVAFPVPDKSTDFCSNLSSDKPADVLPDLRPDGCRNAFNRGLTTKGMR